MSLFSLADPSNSCCGGSPSPSSRCSAGAGLLLFGRGARDEGSLLARVGHWVGVVLCLAIALVAMLAGRLSSTFGIEALQIEAILLSLLMFLSLNLALSLRFRENSGQ